MVCKGVKAAAAPYLYSFHKAKSRANKKLNILREEASHSTGAEVDEHILMASWCFGVCCYIGPDLVCSYRAGACVECCAVLGFGSGVRMYSSNSMKINHDQVFQIFENLILVYRFFKVAHRASFLNIYMMMKMIMMMMRPVRVRKY